MKNQREPILLVDSHNGIYQPQILAEYIKEQNDDIAKQLFNSVKSDDLQCLLNGPDDEFYWESYESIEIDAECLINGVVYTIYQNEDIWLAPVGYEFNY